MQDPDAAHWVPLKGKPAEFRIVWEFLLRCLDEAAPRNIRSGWSSVVKKRSAATVLFMAGAFMPCSDCSIWNRPMFSAVAVQGKRARKAAKPATLRRQGVVRLVKRDRAEAV